MNPYPFYCFQEDLALRHTAIAWLGALLRDQFPTLQPLGGAVTPSGILYQMVGELVLDNSLIPTLQERLRMRLLDSLRLDGGVVTSKEMLQTNAVAFFQHRKEPYLAARLREEENEEQPLLALAEIGSHVEPVPLPHAASIEPLRHLQITSLEFAETRLQNKSRRVWTFYARIASSSKEATKWMRAEEQKQKEEKKGIDHQPGKHSLWVDLPETQERIWTARGTALRNALLSEWKVTCAQLGFEEILTQGQAQDEGFPWDQESAQMCKEAYLRAKACKLLRAAEIRALYREEEESAFDSPFLTSDAVCPEAIAQITRETLAAELKAHLPLLLKHADSSRTRLLITLPRNPNAALKFCLESFQSALAALQHENVEVEKCEEIQTVSCSLLLLDAEGGQWAGPSITLTSHGSSASSSILLLWKAYGTLERWIAWSQLHGLLK